MGAPTIRIPKQERSRRSLEAIYAAAVDLLAEGGWEAVTVGEIERRSGVTRGTFYLRFDTRDSLVDYVNERLTAEVRQLQEETFLPLMSGGRLPLSEACTLAVRGVGKVFERVGRIMVHSERIGRLPSTPEAIGELDNAFSAVLRRSVPPEPGGAAAIEFVSELVFAAFVARQRPDSPFTHHAVLDDDEFTGRLASTICAYLRDVSPEAD